MKSRGANQAVLSTCIPGLQLLLKKMASAPFGVIVQWSLIASAAMGEVTMYPDPKSQSQKLYTRALAEPARRQHPHHRVHEAVSDLCRARRGLPGVRCRRQRIYRLHQQFHLADPWPRPSGAGGGGDEAARAGIGVRAADRVRDRSGRIAGVAPAVGRAGSFHQFRHRSRDDGAEGRARLHRPAEDRQMRGRLSRLLRLCRSQPRSGAGGLGPQCAGLGRLCQGHAGQCAGRCHHHPLQRCRGSQSA